MEIVLRKIPIPSGKNIDGIGENESLEGGECSLVDVS